MSALPEPPARPQWSANRSLFSISLLAGPAPPPRKSCTPRFRGALRGAEAYLSAVSKRSPRLEALPEPGTPQSSYSCWTSMPSSQLPSMSHTPFGGTWGELPAVPCSTVAGRLAISQQVSMSIPNLSAQHLATPPVTSRQRGSSPRHFDRDTPEMPIPLLMQPPQTPRYGNDGRIGFYRVVRKPAGEQTNRPMSVRSKFVSTCQESGVLPLPVMIQRSRRSQGAVVDARGYGVGCKMVGAVCELLAEPLERVDLSQNHLTRECVIPIFSALSAANAAATRSGVYLQILDLSGNQIGPCSGEQATVMQDYLQDSQLHELWLQDTRLGDAAAQQICFAAEFHQHLHTLDLSKCGLGEVAAHAIGSLLLVNRKLQKLNLSWNQIKGEGAVAVAKAVRGSALEELNLGWNSCHGAVISEMASSLLENNSLKKLDLSHNNLRACEAMALAELLQIQTGRGAPLELLTLSNNQLGGTAVRALLGSAVRGSTVLVLLACGAGVCEVVKRTKEPEDFTLAKHVGSFLPQLACGNASYMFDLSLPQDRWAARRVLAWGEFSGIPTDAAIPVLHCKIDKHPWNVEFQGTTATVPDMGVLEIQAEAEHPRWSTLALTPPDEAVHGVVEQLRANMTMEGSHLEVLEALCDELLYLTRAQVCYILEQSKLLHCARSVTLLLQHLLEKDDVSIVGVLGQISILRDASKKSEEIVPEGTHVPRVTSRQLKSLWPHLNVTIPNGRYRLELSDRVQRHVFQSIALLCNEHIQAQKPKAKAGACLWSQNGNGCPMRNEEFEATPFVYSPEWVVPSNGVISFDYFAPLEVHELGATGEMQQMPLMVQDELLCDLESRVKGKQLKCLQAIQAVARFKLSSAQAHAIIDALHTAQRFSEESRLDPDHLHVLISMMNRLSDPENLQSVFTQISTCPQAFTVAMKAAVVERVGNWIVFDPCTPTAWGQHWVQLDKRDDLAFLKYIQKMTANSEFVQTKQVKLGQESYLDLSEFWKPWPDTGVLSFVIQLRGDDFPASEAERWVSGLEEAANKF